MRRLVVERAEDSVTLWTLEVADSSVSRLRGLIGRPSLASAEGLFLPGTNSIHMLFMRFPIDCVFVSSPIANGEREVVAVKQNLRPWTGVVWFVRRARGAIELAAGSAARARIGVGDRLRVVETDL